MQRPMSESVSRDFVETAISIIEGHPAHKAFGKKRTWTVCAEYEFTNDAQDDRVIITVTDDKWVKTHQHRQPRGGFVTGPWVSEFAPGAEAWSGDPMMYKLIETLGEIDRGFST